MVRAKCTTGTVPKCLRDMTVEAHSRQLSAPSEDRATYRYPRPTEPRPAPGANFSSHWTMTSHSFSTGKNEPTTVLKAKIATMPPKNKSAIIVVSMFTLCAACCDRFTKYWNAACSLPQVTLELSHAANCDVSSKRKGMRRASSVHCGPPQPWALRS